MQRRLRAAVCRQQTVMSEPLIEIENCVVSAPAIMVVEDEILIRMPLADELRAAGYRIIETISLRGGAYVDLVLTDVQMSGSMNGDALARVIRSEFPSIKIVVASAHAANSEDVADATFLKPYVDGRRRLGNPGILSYECFNDRKFAETLRKRDQED